LGKGGDGMQKIRKDLSPLPEGGKKKKTLDTFFLFKEKKEKGN